MTTGEIFGQGLYTISEASRLSRVPISTVRSWINGYKVDHRRHKGFIQADIHKLTHTRPISFLALIELCLLGRFKEHENIRISTQKVREVAWRLQKEFNQPHPFAWEGLKTDGRDFFLESFQYTKRDKYLMQLTGRQRENLVFVEIIEPFFKQVDFSPLTKHAERWQPLEGKGLVTLDPMVRFGDPIIANTRIPTSQIFEQIKAGDSQKAVAKFYELDLKEVRAAWRYERQLRNVA